MAFYPPTRVKAITGLQARAPPPVHFLLLAKERSKHSVGSTAGPAQTIIGGTAGSSTAYSNANGSIDNNAPHNPFIQGVAHFTLNIAGVTASTNVTGATFSFGTTVGNNIPATGFSTPIPEPVSSALMGIGLVSLFFLRRRIRS
jgi:hypothetical protein